MGYYLSRYGRNPRAALALATELVTVEKYATECWWIKATLHEELKEYAKAIAAFQNCQNEPKNLWEIAKCHWQLKKLESAIGQLREIENFFPSDAPSAALQIARWYDQAKEEKKCVTALRAVLKKYPDSGESKEAHVKLEEKGYKMGGGIDAN